MLPVKQRQRFARVSKCEPAAGGLLLKSIELLLKSTDSACCEYIYLNHALVVLVLQDRLLINLSVDRVTFPPSTGTKPYDCCQLI